MRPEIRWHGGSGSESALELSDGSSKEDMGARILLEIASTCLRSSVITLLYYLSRSHLLP